MPSAGSIERQGRTLTGSTKLAALAMGMAVVTTACAGDDDRVGTTTGSDPTSTTTHTSTSPPSVAATDSRDTAPEGELPDGPSALRDRFNSSFPEPLMTRQTSAPEGPRPTVSPQSMIPSS